MPQQQYAQYVDSETYVIKRPDSNGVNWGDPFGDGVWRSSWFYASLIVIRALDAAAYAKIKSEHDVDVTLAGQFLEYFRDHCLSNGGWQLPKTTQDFSRDQLVPLLYLFAVVAKHAPEFKATALDILKSLTNLEEQDKGVSVSSKGTIGRNIAYMIDVLCDDARYDLNYRTSDMTAWLVFALGNITDAKSNRRAAYKALFGLALQAHSLTGWLQTGGLDASNEYSVFNALGAVSLQCIAWGKDDGDVKDWRSNFGVHADAGWGPAFLLVAGRSVSDANIDDYATAHITRNLDNDIIMAQRPTKIRDGILTPDLKGGPEQWLTLDYIILKALRLLWA
ncbi:MAG: hypothetical protein PHO08_20125 [Methylococcales bacterium]|nr:hypothetical protein [Methylococcales bacterium]MDD5631165.1 hypothetical protein [Methylococcales bacterium]